MSFAVWFSMLLLLLFVFSTRADDLVVPFGQSKTISVREGQNIRIGSKSLLGVADFGSHLVLTGKKIGETSLSVGSQSQIVQVVPREVEKLRQEFALAFAKMKGLRLSWKSGRLLVDGQLYRFSDWVRLSAIANAVHANYVFAAHPLAPVGEEAIQHFTEIAKANGVPTPRLALAPDLTVSLPAGSETYEKIAEKTFAPFGLEVRVTPSQVRLMPLVRTRVILAELSHESSQTFGVSWPAGYEAKVLPQYAPDDLTLKLNALETKGLGKVLAAPNLLCRSGSQADFLAGGEFPVRTSKIFAGEVNWKQHGVILKVKPTADAGGAISLDIETEVSLLDKANAVENVPALKTNRVHSHFDISGKRTIALSGLLREDWGLNREGLAGLSALPVLGRLFGSRSFQERKSELVIFVTPEVLLPEIAEDELRLPEGWARDDL
jgi:pilus assembly protein CpaC